MISLRIGMSKSFWDEAFRKNLALAYVAQKNKPQEWPVSVHSKLGICKMGCWNNSLQWTNSHNDNGNFEAPWNS